MARKIFLGTEYRSQKHPVLEYIFNKYYEEGSEEDIDFSLADISEGYRYCEEADPDWQIREPSSISNTILDLTRKKRPVSSRLPASIYNLGYDLTKKTGRNSENNNSYAGTFVFVGIGNEYTGNWLTWPDEQDRRTVIVSSDTIPTVVQNFLRNDEGALFSVIDYCDVLSLAFPQFGQIIRIQNPMKWQPNEIDGFYVSHLTNGTTHIFPIEAKALTTNDDINLIQFAGGINTIINKLTFDGTNVINPIAAKMVKNGILLGLFEPISNFENSYQPILIDTVLVVFRPAIAAWNY